MYCRYLVGVGNAIVLVGVAVVCEMVLPCSLRLSAIEMSNTTRMIINNLVALCTDCILLKFSLRFYSVYSR